MLPNPRPRLSRAAVVIVAAIVVLPLTTGLAEAAEAPIWDLGHTVSSGLLDADSPAIALDADGRAVAVWASTGASTPLGNDEAVMVATHAPGGSWTAPQPIANVDAYAPTIVADASGVVTVAFIRDGGDRKVEVVTGSHGAAFGAPVLLSTLPGTIIDVQVSGNAAGDVAVAWLQHDPALNRTTLRVRTRPRGTTSWSAEEVVSGAVDVTAPSLSVGGDGAVALGWLDLVNVSADRRTFARVRYAGGSWTAPQQLSASGVVAATPLVQLGADGRTDAVWKEPVDGVETVRSATLPSHGAWSSPTSLSPPGQSSYEPTLAESPDGGLLVGWHINGTPYTPQTRLRTDAGGWQPVQDVPTGGSYIAAFHLAPLPGGGAVGTWLEDVGGVYVQRLALRRAAGWGTPQTVSASGALSESEMAADAAGNLALLWTRQTASHRIAQARLADIGGPLTSLIDPPAGRTFAPAVTVGWRGHDVAGTVTGYEWSTQRTTWNAAAGPWSAPEAVAGDSRPLPVAPGTRTCVTVRAHSSLGPVGPWSDPRCVVTPVDDRVAKGGKGWHKLKGSRYYAATARRTTRRGATLTFRSAHLTELALVVAKGRHFGKVKVYLGKKRIGTVKLAARHRASRVVVPIRSWPTTVTGTLRIKVVSRGKPVVIDGIYVG
jgi:hypothetical protein